VQLIFISLRVAVNSYRLLERAHDVQQKYVAFLRIKSLYVLAKCFISSFSISVYSHLEQLMVQEQIVRLLENTNVDLFKSSIICL